MVKSVVNFDANGQIDVKSRKSGKMLGRSRALTAPFSMLRGITQKIPRALMGGPSTHGKPRTLSLRGAAGLRGAAPVGSCFASESVRGFASEAAAGGEPKLQDDGNGGVFAEVPLDSPPPWRQSRGKTIVSLANCHTNATSKR